MGCARAALFACKGAGEATRTRPIMQGCCPSSTSPPQQAGGAAASSGCCCDCSCAAAGPRRHAAARRRLRAAAAAPHAAGCAHALRDALRCFFAVAPRGAEATRHGWVTDAP